MRLQSSAPRFILPATTTHVMCGCNANRPAKHKRSTQPPDSNPSVPPTPTYTPKVNNDAFTAINSRPSDSTPNHRAHVPSSVQPLPDANGRQALPDVSEPEVSEKAYVPTKGEIGHVSASKIRSFTICRIHYQ